MSDKFTNNVRARLYKQGYQGFTKDDYIKAALKVNCNDLNNPTKEQLSQAVDYLKVKANRQLSVIDVEDTNVMQTTAPAVNEENQPQQSIEQSENQALTCEDDSEVTALAVQEKSELVSTTAESMGIELELGEVQSIADNLNYSGDLLDETISEIKSAITAFIQYKGEIYQSKISSMIDEVRDVVQRSNAQTSQHLNNGLSQIATDIEQANLDFKSQVKTSLKCFALPVKSR